MSTEPVNALAKQFAPDAGLTRPCCLPHSRVEPCHQCAARPPGTLPDAATRERQDARRYRFIRTAFTRPVAYGGWYLTSYTLTGATFDAAIDAAMTAEETAHGEDHPG